MTRCVYNVYNTRNWSIVVASAVLQINVELIRTIVSTTLSRRIGLRAQLTHPSSAMSFKDGELVWAKIKGYPYWPAKVLAKSKAPPKVLKSEHRSSDLLVRFFGKPVTYGWMLAKDLQHFNGNKADTKSTSKKLSYAIDEAIRHEKQLKQGLDSSDSSDSSDEESSQEDSSESPREEIKPKKRGRKAKSRDESKSATKQNGKIEDKARDQRLMKREQARQQSRAAESAKKPRGRPSRGNDTPVKSVKTETVKEEKQPVESKAKNRNKTEKKSASTKSNGNDKSNHKNDTSASDKNNSNDRSTSPVRREEKKKPVYRMEDTSANDTPVRDTPAISANDVDHTPPKKRKRDSDEDDSHEDKKRRKLSVSGEGKSGELTLDKLNAYKVSLRHSLKDQNESAAVRLLHKLQHCHVTLELLQKSKIGKTVKEYQQHPNKEVAQLCTEIFDSYLRLYKAEFGLNGSFEPSSVTSEGDRK